MARIRSIKPEFATDEKNLEMSDSCALFFILLWNHCDDEGKIKNQPNEIAKKLARWHKGKVQLYLNSLTTSGQLRINSTSTWYQVVNWSHQRINKPKQPEVKASDLEWITNNDSVTIPLPFTEHSVQGSRIKDQGSRIGSIRQGEGKDETDIDSEEKKEKENSSAAENDQPEKEKGLHQKIIDSWYEWRTKATGVNPKVGGADVKAAERLVKYFLALNDPPDEERSFRAWLYILENWKRLDTWTQNQVGLNQIESRINNIIEQLRNGKPPGTGKSAKPSTNDVAAEILKRHGVAPTGTD
jgi:hypothetical protein